MALEEFAAAKVNLALHILGRRADGYHELDSLVAFADVGDRLWFEPAADLRLSVSGPFADGVPHSGGGQIVLRAADALRRAAGVQAGAAIHLEKNLPVASGIGGGSADAAAALRGLSRLWGVQADLHAIALGLGADVPVCLSSQACRMRGAGERIESLGGFAALPAVLVNPRLAVGTADVFRRLGLVAGQSHGEGLAAFDDLSLCRNDLTAPALAVRPEIGGVLARLQRIDGLRLARMSGSGATCFALCVSANAAARAAAELEAERPDWWVKAAVLGSAH